MNDKIDAERLQAALRRLDAESFVNRLVLSILVAEVVARGSEGDTWIESLETQLTNATSALAADPTRPQDERVRADAMEAAATRLMETVRSYRARAGR